VSPRAVVSAPSLAAYAAPAFAVSATQAATRRAGGAGVTGRFALRVGVRVLAVTGIAGAAWLLGASVAQADQGHAGSTGTTSSSLPIVSLVGDSGTGITGGVVLEAATVADTSVLAPVLTSTGQLTGAGAPATTAGSVVSDTTATQATPIAQAGMTGSAGSASTRGTGGAASAASIGDARPTGSHSGTGSGSVTGLSGLLGDLVPPIGGALPGAGALSPVSTAIIRILDPITAPVAGVVAPVIRTVTGTGATGGWGVLPGRTPTGSSAGAVPTTPVHTGPAVESVAQLDGPPVRTIIAPVKWSDSASGSAESRSHLLAGTLGTFLPDRPVAPLQAHLGGGGTSAPGSGCHGDGGQSAVVATSPTGSAADIRRLRAVSEVAALRREPAAPTVAPD
jgi:hypothetical protein